MINLIRDSLIFVNGLHVESFFQSSIKNTPIPHPSLRHKPYSLVLLLCEFS